MSPGQSGAIASVFLVDVLDNFFAPLVLKIDIDVRRLTTFRRNETFENQIAAFGIHLSDTERETDA